MAKRAHGDGGSGGDVTHPYRVTYARTEAPAVRSARDLGDQEGDVAGLDGVWGGSPGTHASGYTDSLPRILDEFARIYKRKLYEFVVLVTGFTTDRSVENFWHLADANPPRQPGSQQGYRTPSSGVRPGSGQWGRRGSGATGVSGGVSIGSRVDPDGGSIPLGQRIGAKAKPLAQFTAQPEQPSSLTQGTAPPQRPSGESTRPETETPSRPPDPTSYGGGGRIPAGGPGRPTSETAEDPVFGPSASVRYGPDEEEGPISGEARRFAQGLMRLRNLTPADIQMWRLLYNIPGSGSSLEERSATPVSRAIELAKSRGSTGAVEMVNDLHAVFLSPVLQAAMKVSLRDIRLMSGHPEVSLHDLISSDDEDVRVSFAQLTGKRIEYTKWTNSNFSNATKGRVLGAEIEALQLQFKKLEYGPTGHLKFSNIEHVPRTRSALYSDRGHGVGRTVRNSTSVEASRATLLGSYHAGGELRAPRDRFLQLTSGT